MKNKNAEQKFFQIYLDTEDIVNLLSDEDRGKLFSLLYRFAIDGETPEINDNPALAIAFKMFTAQIARDFATYERKANTARENGKKGGAPKGNRNAVKQPKTTKTTEIAQEKEEEKEEEEESMSAKDDSFAADDVTEIISLFDRICSGIPRSSSPDTLQRRIIQAKSALNGTGFEEYFRRVAMSDFLTGRSGKWKGCTLEWLLKPDTIAKVLGGFYEDRGLPEPPPHPRRKTSYDITELEKIDTLDGW